MIRPAPSPAITLPPLIPKSMGFTAYTRGTLPYLISVCNGADGLVFTDKEGTPITASPINSADSLSHPPCHIHKIAVVDIDWVGGNAGEFVGMIDQFAEPGIYTFYVRAYNRAGYSDVCTCTVEVILHI